MDPEEQFQIIMLADKVSRMTEKDREVMAELGEYLGSLPPDDESWRVKLGYVLGFASYFRTGNFTNPFKRSKAMNRENDPSIKIVGVDTDEFMRVVMQLPEVDQELLRQFAEYLIATAPDYYGNEE